MTDIQKLKEAALAATQGVWVAEQDNLYFYDDGYTKHLMETSEGSDLGYREQAKNLAFIAAANPAAVLELVWKIERLERKNSNQAQTIREYSDLVMGGDVSLGMLRADIRVTTGERDQLKSENDSLRQQLALPSDVLADCEALRLENEALRKDAELANSGRAKLAGAMSRLRFKHNDWDLPDRLPDAELILCCCGHSYPPSSYDAGFMAASGGVCEKCDAMSKDSPHD